MIFKISKYLLNWFVIDFFVALFSITLSGLFWRSLGPFHIGITISMIVALEFATIFSVVGWLLGMQSISWSKASAGDVYIIVYTTAFASSGLYILNWFSFHFPNQIIVLASLLAFLGFVVVRFRFRLASGFGARVPLFFGRSMIYGERVLIVGCGDAGQNVATLLENSQLSKKFHVVGFIDDDHFKFGTRFRSVPVLGAREDIPRIVKEKDVGVILFSIHNILPEELEKCLALCRQTEAQIVMVPDVMGQINQAAKRNGKYSSPAKEIRAGYDYERQVSVAKSEIYAHLRDLMEDLEKGHINRGLIRLSEIQHLFEGVEEYR